MLTEGGTIDVDSAGGGNEGIASSSVDDVSMVMCFVKSEVVRGVYKIGEHFTAMEGFLCPGR